MGALLGTLVQRWSITGNDSMNKLISESMFFQPASMFAAPGLAPSHNRYMTAYEVKLTVALLETLAQVGLAKNFEPDEEKLELGNDDQAFWAFTVLDMAELGFPDPPPDKPSWLGLAQAVFNRQTAQWDDTTCGGGMRWQKFSTNTGYDYKNLPSNGGYFQIAARLARYTGNNTYVEYAEKMWDWISESGMWQEHNGRLELFDGVHISVCDKNKTAHDPPKFTYNIGFLYVPAHRKKSRASSKFDRSTDPPTGSTVQLTSTITRRELTRPNGGSVSTSCLLAATTFSSYPRRPTRTKRSRRA
jgi:hypothetical protein